MKFNGAYIFNTLCNKADDVLRQHYGEVTADYEWYQQQLDKASVADLLFELDEVTAYEYPLLDQGGHEFRERSIRMVQAELAKRRMV
jgi:hypothetical protein